jgi:hypothetical protein
MGAEEIRGLISQARMEAAIDSLLDITGNTGFHNKAAAISGMYNKYKHDSMMGILNNDEQNKSFNSITKNILDLLNDYESKTKNASANTNARDLREENIERTVYISYAWGGESEIIADKIQETFKHKGILVIRDKTDLGFKGRIKTFMKNLGAGKRVILIISDKYLKSKNCLFELLHIARHKNFVNRVFPIILEDAHIFKPKDIVLYVQYWEKQVKELDDAIRTISSANLKGIRDDIDLYTEIRLFLPGLLDILRDMNALTAEIHVNSDFTDLYNKILE